MADENLQDVTEAMADDVEKAPAGKSKLWVVITTATVLLGGGGGFVTARLLRGGPAQARAETTLPEEQSTEPVPSAEKNVKPGGELAYLDFETIVVNANEPRMSRYIRVSITLAVPKSDLETVQKAVEKRRPELRDWLNTYFSGCTLEDVRGPRNQNRIRREVQDALNEHLWPKGKPSIEMVLFKEFAVQ